MNDERNQASEIRAYVDGELERQFGVEAAGRFESRLEADPDLAAQVRYERGLREHVGRVLGHAAPAPPELAAQVQTMLKKAADDPAGSAAAYGRSARAVSPRTSARGRGWLVGPPKANVFAVAATLALIAGAVMFGIFGPSIDDIAAESGRSLVREVGSFVSTEHRDCATDLDRRAAKTTWTTPAEAEQRLFEHLGVPVLVIDLSAYGYRFVGAGKCGLPGPDASGHLIYALSEPGHDECPEAMLSLFVVRDHGQLDFVPGSPIDAWTWTVVGDRPPCGKRVMGTSDGIAAFFIVCCNESRTDALSRAVARAQAR